MMWGGGLYGRPLLEHHPRSCSMTRSRHGTQATRAAIKAPALPNTTPAPTEEYLFLHILS
jgi:hypothetical protein